MESGGFDAEFQTVEDILDSDAKTRGVDAFCLAWIKYERQMRKIVAYLVFQASDVSEADSRKLREAFLDNKDIDHKSFRGAIQRLGGIRFKDRMGDRYPILENAIDRSWQARNKLFHGQQTGNDLSRESLVELTRYLQEWCRSLAEIALVELGYDGFSGSNSLTKSANIELVARVDSGLAITKSDWKQFIRSL